MLAVKIAPASSVRWSGLLVTLPLHEFQDGRYARIDTSHGAEIRHVPSIFCLLRLSSRGGGLGDCLIDQLALRQRGFGDLLVVPLLPALHPERFPGLLPLSQTDGREPERASAGLYEMTVGVLNEYV